MRVKTLSRLQFAFVKLSGAGLLSFLRALTILGMTQIARPDECTSQEPSKPTIQVETDLVAVRAVFVDSRGKRVSDVRADDVVLLDNSKVQRLSKFEAPVRIENAQAAGSPGRSAKEPVFEALRDQQTLEVLILLTGMWFNDRHYALEAVARYLERKHDGHTKVAVADASGTMLPFTSEGQEMTDFARSLLKLSIPPVGFESWKFHRSAGQLCQSMKEMPGRKAIVLVSDFYRSRNPAIYTTQPDDLLSTALDIGAAVYAVDSRGVVPVIPFGDASSPGGSFNASAQSFALMHENGAMAYISSATGGDYQPGNDLGAIFRDVEQDASSSYLLEYYNAGLKHDGSFHSIKVLSKREGIQARTRIGYFAPLPGLSDLDPSSQLKMALASEYPFHDILIQFRPYFFPSAGPGTKTIVVGIVGVEFSWVAQASDPLAAGPLSIIGTIRAPGNGVEDFSDQAVPRAVSEPENSLSYDMESTIYMPAMRLSPGENSIKLAARSVTGKLGTAVLRLAIPQQQPFGIEMSSLVISRQAEVVNTAGRRADLYDPLVVGDLRIAPHISNRFKASDNLTFFARVTGWDKKTPLSASISVKEVRDMRLVGTFLKDIMDPGDSSSFDVPVLFELSASNFARESGAFVAELTIKQGSGQVVASRSATFTVSGQNNQTNADREP